MENQTHNIAKGEKTSRSLVGRDPWTIPLEK